MDPILAGEHDFADSEVHLPIAATEIAVFHQLQVTVRGVIPLSKEKYILAFGANYLAMIELDQLIDGGQLCQSHIASTRGIIVGGRRMGPNKVQVFYESGSFETMEVAKKKNKNFAIVRKGANKLNLKGSKVTSLVVSGPHVLLGTSSGQVVSHLGKIYLKGEETNGAVRQMTVINEHIVLLLFQNKSLALLDLRYHALRSVVEERFTAIESVFSTQHIMAGDLDGVLHCFRISPNGTRMRLANSSKCIYRTAITCLFPIHAASLARFPVLHRKRTTGFL